MCRGPGIDSFLCEASQVLLTDAHPQLRKQGRAPESEVRVRSCLVPSHLSASVCRRRLTSRMHCHGRLSFRSHTAFWTCRSFANSRGARHTMTVLLVGPSRAGPRLSLQDHTSSGSHWSSSSRACKSNNLVSSSSCTVCQ